MPSPSILALATAFATVVCVMLAGRRLSGSRLAASVLLSQVAYHALFLVGGGGGDVSVVGDPHAHLHGGETMQLVAGGMGAAGHAAHSPAMYVAHLLAAVLTIAALRHGERILWTLGAQWSRVVLRIVARASALLAPTSPCIAVLGATEPCAPHPLDAALTARRHRGPPLRALRVA